MNPSKNIERIADKQILPNEDDGDDNDSPEEKKLKRIQLNMKIRSISNDKWRNDKWTNGTVMQRPLWDFRH